MQRPSSERTSITWKTFISRTASRPATAITNVSDSHPVIHSAAIVLDGVVVIGAGCGAKSEGVAGIGDIAAVCNGQICGCSDAGRRAKASANKDKKRKGFAHADLAAGRMEKAARLFPWCRGRRAGPLGGAGRADRRRRDRQLRA